MNDIDRDARREAGNIGQLSRSGLIVNRLRPILVTGLAIAGYMISLNLPWIKDYVANRVNDTAMTDLGHWLIAVMLIALLVGVAVYSLRETMAGVLAAASAFGAFSIGLFILGWMARGRFDLNNAFQSMNVLWSVLVTAGAFAAVFLLVYWLIRRS